MFESKTQIKTRNFLGHIKLLSQNSSDRAVEGFQKTEKELIKQFISETSDFIDHNEWGTGLENLLDNLYEIGFTIDQKGIDLIKDAIQECGMEYKDWIFIEELVKR
ncbi:MAG: hypothetical protein J7604_09105 [Sporocytophaga sp.]|uniref:hypothetical protein n=1 Tax=Sporocytophaga sp. TaxID=2231183 RepID=UPI001B2A9CEE|nr:hypothetical protein [Sporocytophaga sp.]MBO9700352.1 hypothetical protein [Sporocytophaga sp.]